MIEFPLIFVAGFLGSSHCVGMCGPFALLLGASHHRSWTSSLVRQLVYSMGRVFTYASMGAVAGYAGIRLTAFAPSMVNVPAVLSIIAGSLLIYQGFATSGLLDRLRLRVVTGPGATSAPCLAGGLLANFLKSRNQFDIFLAGLFTGFLPCGLVYSFVGLAATTQNIMAGTLTMATFGLGTIPIMVATGLGGGLISMQMRSRLLRLAAICVVIAGAVTVVRGVSFLTDGQAGAVGACPLCP